MADRDETASTEDASYTARLVASENRRWKRLLGVQAPYRWNLRRLGLGRTLDVGCGIGRNLVDLPAGSVGIDHNPDSVAKARARGCTAFIPDEFVAAGFAAFDSMLVAHVLEHLPPAETGPLLARYLPSIRAGGRVVLITPQEAGFRSDPTHVDYIDAAALQTIVAELGLAHLRSYSFPFPRWVGRWFPHNEFVTVAAVPVDDKGAR